MLDIGSFRFESVVLEIRYENAYLLWDNAGTIWHEFSQLHPRIKSSEIEPNQQRFSDEKSLEYQVKLDRAHVIQHRPPTNLKEFCEVSDDFCEILSKNLDLMAFSRIGLRTQYYKIFKSQEEAALILLKGGLIRTPSKKTFNIEAPIKEAVVHLRTEDDEIGVRVSMNIINRKVHFTAPLNAPELESKEFEEAALVYDVDYYTCAPILVKQFKPGRWIEQSHQLIRRESGTYFGGV